MNGQPDRMTRTTFEGYFSGAWVEIKGTSLKNNPQHKAKTYTGRGQGNRKGEKLKFLWHSGKIYQGKTWQEVATQAAAAKESP